MSLRRRILTLAVAAGLSLLRASAPAAADPVLPFLPAVWLDTTYVAPTGGTVRPVNAGGDLQAALDAAQPGDVITLEAGATFTGNYTLPPKSGAGWIIIRTSAPDSSLPPPGTRITPADAAMLPNVVSAAPAPAIATQEGAHHYRLIVTEVPVGPGDLESRALRDRDPREPPLQAALVEERRSELCRDSLGREEHLRAEARPAGSGGRQQLRARVGGRRRDRVRDHLHPPQRRRRRTVVRGAGFTHNVVRHSASVIVTRGTDTIQTTTQQTTRSSSRTTCSTISRPLAGDA